MSPIRVLVADDHALFRDGLKALFDSVDDIELGGEAASGAEVLEKLGAIAPDIVLMDVQMEGMSGIEATAAVAQRRPETGVIVLTMFEDTDLLLAAMRAGARGYMLKDAGQEELLRTIRAVAAGEALFGAAVAGKLLSLFGSQAGGPPSPFPELTEREREILALLAQGKDNAAIAGELFLSQKTVRNYVSSVFSKLQVESRAQAIVRAREAGMGGDGR